MIGTADSRSRVATMLRQPDVTVPSDVFALPLDQQGGLVDDVEQARIAIECQAIRPGCGWATTVDLERRREALAHVEATIDDPICGAEADCTLHASLVRAARPQTLSGLDAAVSTRLARSQRNRRFPVQAAAEIRRSLPGGHRRVFDTLVAGDQARADRVLRRQVGIGGA